MASSAPPSAAPAPLHRRRAEDAKELFFVLAPSLALTDTEPRPLFSPFYLPYSPECVEASFSELRPMEV